VLHRMAQALYTYAVLGASGNVGKKVVQQLAISPKVGKIVLFHRRDVPELKNIEKVENVVVDMINIEPEVVKKHLHSVDAFVITMGVGKPSKAQKAELIRIDVDLPTAFAKIAKDAGVNHVSLLTSVGADIAESESWLTGTGAGGGLYLHLKGLVEQNIFNCNFQTAYVYHPAGIIGSSNSPDFLLGLMTGDWLGKFKSIHIDVLATSIVNGSLLALEKKAPSQKIIEGAELFDLGGTQPLPQ